VQIVPDANVLVSAAVTPAGVCGTLLAALERNPLDVVVSPLLLAEVERVLRRSRLAVAPAVRVAFLRHVTRIGLVEDDPPPAAGMLVEADPGDDYLVRLALASPDRILVSGDPHLLALAGTYPIVEPRALLDRLLAAEGVGE
jgi:putative PIN family toxin of toxin-antitoxin system